MFEWKPDYSVKIASIDAEHQRLFALAAELHAAMSQGKGKAILTSAFARLADYTRTHFANEEQFMSKHAYPDVKVHKALHDALNARVLELQNRFANGEPCVTADLSSFLENWLKHHINGADQKYSAYIRSKTADAALSS